MFHVAACCEHGPPAARSRAQHAHRAASMTARMAPSEVSHQLPSAPSPHCSPSFCRQGNSEGRCTHEQASSAKPLLHHTYHARRYCAAPPPARPHPAALAPPTAHAPCGPATRLASPRLCSPLAASRACHPAGPAGVMVGGWGRWGRWGRGGEGEGASRWRPTGMGGMGSAVAHSSCDACLAPALALARVQGPSHQQGIQAGAEVGLVVPPGVHQRPQQQLADLRPREGVHEGNAAAQVKKGCGAGWRPADR